MDQIPSNLKFGRTNSRRTDIILDRAETLIDLYNGSPEEFVSLVHACDLFFTLDYWLKYYKSNALFEKEQAATVQSLYVAVVNVLCKAFKCTVNVLPRELELMFGRELTEEGYKVDIVWGQASYVQSPKQLSKYRLRFKDGGKAYQYPWWQGSSDNGVLVLAESSRCQPVTTVHIGTGDKPNWGYCVMTMNREIYMAQHASAKRDSRARVVKGAYHSYYLEGQPVQFAGSMLIMKGKVVAVCPDSGHYKPNDNNTLAFLLALTMFGVPLFDVAVCPWDASAWVLAQDFIDAKADWNLLRVNQSANLSKNAADWLYKQPPEIKKWVAWATEQARLASSPGSGPGPSPGVGSGQPGNYNGYGITPVTASVQPQPNHYGLSPVTPSDQPNNYGGYGLSPVSESSPSEPQEDFIPNLEDAELNTQTIATV
jgi:hypothetical protein